MTGVQTLFFRKELKGGGSTREGGMEGEVRWDHGRGMRGRLLLLQGEAGLGGYVR